jgi:formylglycine-generating enzyme required for sulfatase activity
VTVSDGRLSASDTFVLKVNGNSAPAITSVADQIIAISASTEALPFTINDAHTSASSLTLSGSSSNTTLVPNANIVFGGSGANRTVTVTPASNQSGTATITVTVSDGSLSTSDTFVLTVNSAPTISDITDQGIDAGGSTAAIVFTISDSETVADSLSVSGSSSNTTLVPNANIVFGGSEVNRTVTVSSANGQTGTTTITVTVSDGSLSVTDTFILTINSGFTLIPQGSFTMGDSLDGESNAPTRTVTLDAFYMGKHEVTKGKWDEVRSWGLSNGYTDLAEGSGKASDHPVGQVNWYDTLKWCNARSEMEGLAPVYYTNDTQTTIYKMGSVDVTNAQVNWAANGYRLPTEAEWEKAARGGLEAKRFPWGDTISHILANYFSHVAYVYDVSSTRGLHPTYGTGIRFYSSPVGAFAANGYELYDTAGNSQEWCWDWYGAYAVGSQSNPFGASPNVERVIRGGSAGASSRSCRVADRYHYDPSGLGDQIGFRVVRSSVP